MSQKLDTAGRRIEIDLDEVATRPILKTGTDHLPAQDVQAPVTVGIWATDHPEHPTSRTGMHFMSFRVGDLDNPQPDDLSDGQVEYVARVIELAAEKFRSVYAARKPAGQHPGEIGTSIEGL